MQQESNLQNYINSYTWTEDKDEFKHWLSPLNLNSNKIS